VQKIIQFTANIIRYNIIT